MATTPTISLNTLPISRSLPTGDCIQDIKMPSIAGVRSR